MNHVIIGNGIAGVSAAQAIRRRDDTAAITLIGDESGYFFSRTALMWVFMGRLERRDLEPYERHYWRENRFDVVHDQVVTIDPVKRELTLRSGSTRGYDRLLLATGSEASRYDWPGRELQGVCTFTTLGDLDRLEKYWRSGVRRAVVVGGGLIGIELVECFHHRGCRVQFLVREPWYFKQALSRQEASMVHDRIVGRGCEVFYNEEISRFDGDHGRLNSLVTRSGRELSCDVAGIAVGVHPRIGLARRTGLECNRGIIVDRSFRTSIPEILAAGDCAEISDSGRSSGLVQSLWYTAVKQGLAAGRAMSGEEIVFDPGIPYNAAQFFGLDWLTVGWMNDRKPDLTESAWLDRDAGRSIRIAHDDRGRVQGFSMLGGRYQAAVLQRWIEESRPVDHVMGRLDQEAGFDEEFTPAAAIRRIQ